MPYLAIVLTPPECLQCSGHVEEGVIDKRMGSNVVVKGPPGTEPGRANSPDKDHFKSTKSMVYSRMSLGASLSLDHTPSFTQVQSIPSKDIPLVKTEVYATPNIRFRR